MTTSDLRVTHGTNAWFEMAGTLMCEFASEAKLPPDLNVSFVERYTDGTKLLEGFIQGLRFEIIGGTPSYRVGVRQDERAEITVEITTSAARELNTLQSADPKYKAALKNFVSTGEMRTDGDTSRLGDWLSSVHDPIVDRTS